MPILSVVLAASAYTLVPVTDGLELKTPDGRTVFQYVTRKPANTRLLAPSACYFHPLNTPAGERVTDVAPGDHRHHRGVFLAWHSMEFREKADFSSFGPTGPTRGFNINRGDFWGWGQFAPTQDRVIRNRDVRLAQADAGRAVVEIVNDWMIGDSRVMEEATTAEVRERDGVYVVDLAYKLTPAQDLLLNQTAFGGFCVRARNDGESYYANAAGKVGLADPHYSAPELNWPAADWYDYTIALAGGKTIGAAVVDHPGNPAATWHNPRYVWMVNPCIVARGPVTAKQGTPLTLRYRVVTHDGATPKVLLDTLAKEWKSSPAAADRGVPLFDGATLRGWHVSAKPADRGKGFWKVVDGAITCDSRGRADHDYVWLVSDGEYSDFDLTLKVRGFRESKGNSGVQVRSRYDEAAGWLDGPQIDLHPPGPWRTGWIYDETRGVRHWIHPSLPDSNLPQAQGSKNWTWKFSGEGDGWNDLRIVCRGTNIRTWLNGNAVADFNGDGLLNDENHRARGVGLKGHIALQLHIKDDLYIQYKDIFVRALR